MKLSVITINYNNREGLADTICSVESQTLKDFEWIVVDGGSTDGSRELIEAHKGSFTSWVSEPDSGIYNAMNKGIRMSGGEYLLFLNSGDQFADNQVVDKVLPELKGEDFIVGNIYHSDKPGIPAFKEINAKPWHLAFMLTTSSLPHQSTFTHRSVFERYGYYREDLRIVSDWAKLMEALVFGHGSLRYIPIVISIYDAGGISSVNRKLYDAERRKVQDEWKYFSPYFVFYRNHYEMTSAIKQNGVASLFNRFVFFVKRHNPF